jgi:histone deacetylase complex subunit SAP18
MAEMQRRQGGRPFALTARAFPPPPPPIDREKVHVSFSLSGFF